MKHSKEAEYLGVSIDKDGVTTTKTNRQIEIGEIPNWTAVHSGHVQRRIQRQNVNYVHWNNFFFSSLRDFLEKKSIGRTTSVNNKYFDRVSQKKKLFYQVSQKKEIILPG